MKSILFFLFFTISVFSQVAVKNEYLFDEIGNIITQQEFKKKYDTLRYTYIVTENDTASIAKLLLLEEFGTVTENEKQRVIKEIENLTQKKISNDQTIIINYFFKESTKNQKPCIDHYIVDKRYKRYFKQNTEYVQIFMTEKEFNYNKNFVFEDKSETIRNLLFKYGSECGNYIIIKPNGKFYRRIGEYRQDDIVNKIETDW